MPCSPAKLEANRRNALKSTGPRTDEGKERCRGNALKHGLTGRGVVLPVEDEAAIEARFVAFEEELRVEGEVGRFLARRAALMSVRLERAAEHEAAMLSRKLRVAEELYDEERKSFVDELADNLREAPATVVRRLRSMPEGIDWLVGAWKAVKADLLHPTRDVWNGGHWSRVENLMGRRLADYPAPAPEVEALCHACWGNLEMLGPGQGAGLAPEARKAWARAQLAAWIDDKVAELESLRPTLDRTRIAADRADAARRTLFDPSPQAILARKYEAAAERGLYRALKEIAALREVEAQARAGEAEASSVETATVGPFFPEAEATQPPSSPRDRGQTSGSEPGPTGPSSRGNAGDEPIGRGGHGLDTPTSRDSRRSPARGRTAELLAPERGSVCGDRAGQGGQERVNPADLKAADILS